MHSIVYLKKLITACNNNNNNNNNNSRGLSGVE